MYRPKNCKKCGGKMQNGGIPTFTSQQQLDAANQQARQFALARGLSSGENTYVGKNVGDPMPQFVNPQGIPTQPNNIQGLNSYVPPEVNDLQWSTEANLPYYTDPQSGDIKYTTPSNFYLPRFKKDMVAHSQGQALLQPNMAMRMKGGHIERMQQGGLGDFNNPLTDDQIIPGVNAPYPIQSQQLNPVQQGINQGLINPPNGFDGNAQQWYDSMQQSSTSNKKRKNPYQTLQNIGIDMQATTAGLGWLSGAVERGRQNQYDMKQQTALGQMNPIQSSDFQPNPYSLYAKYGGNLKTIMEEYNKWSNNAGPMDMTEVKGNPELKKGGYEIDRMIIMRKLLPELLFGRGPHHYKEEGGTMAKGGNWLKGAVDPDHKGWCTPLSNPHCTGHRRAFALMMKKNHGFHND